MAVRSGGDYQALLSKGSTEPGKAALIRPAGQRSRPSWALALAQVEAAENHIEPEELGEHLRQGNPKVLVVDIRPADGLHGRLIRLSDFIARYK